jgi:16S rRNA (guanine966-N2)-methyltransferase
MLCAIYIFASSRSREGGAEAARMALRLSGGVLAGRRIRAAAGPALRPTPGRVKEALFSILGERIAGAAVLDLFAGTGAIGFEAISRGASHVVFVELYAAAAAAIRETGREIGIAERMRTVRADAYRACAGLRDRFDFVYADPPYEAPAPIDALAALRASGAIDAQTVIVYERRSNTPTVHFPGFTTTREARYGEVLLQFLRADV